MKQLILLSILTLSYWICKGQKTSFAWAIDSLNKKYGIGGWSTASVGVADIFQFNSGVLAEIVKPENDTVRVYFLYSDTENFSSIGAVARLYGYKVYDYTNDIIIYLDEQKHKLPKSIIVWQDIEKENQ